MSDHEETRQNRGLVLHSDAQNPTPPTDGGTRMLPPPPDSAGATRALPADSFAVDGLPTRIQLVVRESGEVIERAPQSPIVLGRRNSTQPVDVDLSGASAQEMGVSRNHLRIEPMSQHLLARDLDTVNGSFLNGVRMNPMQAYVLQHEDELKLGRIHIKVYFIYAQSKRR